MRRPQVAAAILVGCAMLTGCSQAYVAPPMPPDPVQPTGELPVFGSQFHGLWDDYPPEHRAAVLDVLRANEVESVRIDVSWNMLQPDGPGEFSEWGFQRIDGAIQEAVAADLEPLVTFWMAPEWANGSTDERKPPTSKKGLAALTAVTRDLGRTYKGVVDAWEVWNEPNHRAFFTGTDPAEYAAVLKAAYKGFKEGNPNATVVMAGTAYVDVEWVRAALDAGADGYFDVMGVHPYPAVADEPPDTPDDGTVYHFAHLPELRRLMLERGDADKSVWITEWSYRAGVNTPDTLQHRRKLPVDMQVEYSLEALEMMRTQYPWVERAYWYEDRAFSNDVNATDNGLVMPNGLATPVLIAMGDLYRNPPTQSTSGSSTSGSPTSR